MDGWMDGWMELSLLRLVQSFFGLLGRLSNCCPLSSRFFKKQLVACASDLIGLRWSACCVDVILFAFLRMEKYSK